MFMPKPGSISANRGAVGHDIHVLDAELLANVICVVKGRECAQRVELKVSHFALEDHTANNTLAADIGLEGEEKEQ